MISKIALALLIVLASPIVLAATVNVPADFLSIQDAINNATEGDTILVAAGTYNEDQLIIDKRLNIIGDGADITIIDGGNALLSETGLVRIIATGDVTFRGFTVRNAGGVSNGGDGNDGKTNVGIYTQSASSSSDYVISECKIYGTNDQDDEEDYGFYSHSGKERLVFSNNTISETGANSILLEKHVGSVSIENNSLDGGVYGIDSIFAMTYGEVDINSLYSIKNNYFDLGTGTFDHGAAAISIASSFALGGGDGKFTNVEIKGNTIDNLKQNRRGITLWNGDLTNGMGGEITAIISENSFIGENAADSRGISLLGKTENVEIINNSINDLWRGIWITDSITGGLHYSENAVVNYNSIEGNDFGLVWNGLTTLDAENNWWGSCSGPSGDDVTGIGIVDYDPWIGVCIEEQFDVDCAFETGNVSLKARLNGSYIESVWMSTTINDTEKNYSATYTDGNYISIIPSSDLIGGQNVLWNVHVLDSFGREYSGTEDIFYIDEGTNLEISPSLPDGNNGWYTSEPLFTMVSNGDHSYYQWDSDVSILYSLPFDLDDAPNGANVTGGQLEINYWSNFGSCGNETKQNKLLNLDLANPIIKNLLPSPDSVINNPVIEISGYIDDPYGSNSGINLSSIIMELDGEPKNITVKEQGSQDAKINFTTTLIPGMHTVYIYAEDNSGRWEFSHWSFFVDLPPEFDINIVSPLDEIYESKRVLFNISIEDEGTPVEVDSIEYLNYNDKHPRWKRLCRNCEEYIRNSNVNEGQNNITIRASADGIVKEINISLFVDSKKPIVHAILPKKNGVTNGDDFWMKYSEDDIKEVLLYINKTNENESVQGTHELNCTSGKRQECSALIDLSDHDGEPIEYWFEVSDSINTVITKKTSVMVDTTSPILTINMPQNETYGRKVPFNLSVSEEVDIEYMDLWDENPKWKKLCGDCDEYGLERAKAKNFRKGIHEIVLRTTDEAGNTDEASVGFLVDY